MGYEGLLSRSGGLLNDPTARRSAYSRVSQNPCGKCIVFRVKVRGRNAKHLGQLFGRRKMGQVLAHLILIDPRARDSGIDPGLYSELLLRNAGALTSFPQATANNAHSFAPTLAVERLRDS